MKNSQGKGVWIRIRFVLRGWIRIRIRKPAYNNVESYAIYSNFNILVNIGKEELFFLVQPHD